MYVQPMIQGYGRQPKSRTYPHSHPLLHAHPHPPSHAHAHARIQDRVHVLSHTQHTHTSIAILRVRVSVRSCSSIPECASKSAQTSTILNIILQPHLFQYRETMLDTIQYTILLLQLSSTGRKIFILLSYYPTSPQELPPCASRGYAGPPGRLSSTPSAPPPASTRCPLASSRAGRSSGVPSTRAPRRRCP